MNAPLCSIVLSTAIAGASAVSAQTQSAPDAADLIVINAKVHTMNVTQPTASAFAVRDGLFLAVGSNAEMTTLRGESTRAIDAGGRTVIPGLNDSHLHAIRAGRFYNLELRWDGVESLERGLQMIREQAARTPEGQWVRVIGGWSPYQFHEKRMPTIVELNNAAPSTPVLVLFLYSQALVNRAGVVALGLTPESKPPEGGRYEFVEDGGAILHADPNPAILYTTIARLPSLKPDEQINSTQHFFRELNRLGVTSVVDPGGGGHAYPADYAATNALATEPKFPVRIASYLFAQKAGSELADYQQWTARERLRVNMAATRLNSYFLEGAGENLAWSAGDFENFMAPRPELKSSMEGELDAIVRVLAQHQWPIRIHATYDESITRILDVFEPVFRETGYRARWAIDHAETISPTNIARIKAMGGGIAIQNRMAFAGEYFIQRYGHEAAANAPPLRRMLDSGIPIGAGTDATRVSSHNPWVALDWMVTGKTVGGTRIAADNNLLTREEALRLFTVGSAWFSAEEGAKSQIAPGQYADFAILTADYFTVPDEQIRTIESVLTVTGGDVVYARNVIEGVELTPLPPVKPDWSPVARFGAH
jgi:predicted amidohydrolase YtcJ